MELARLVLELDVPQCGCPTAYVPLCLSSLRPCSLRKERAAMLCRKNKDWTFEEAVQKATCECPKRSEPCEHVLGGGMLNGLDSDSVISLLYGAYPKHYLGPSKSPRPTVALTREARIACLEQRFLRDQRLFHDQDRVKMPTGIVIESETRGNGKIMQTGMVKEDRQ